VCDEATYFDPESEHDLTPAEIGKLPPERQTEIAKHWFFQHYEDPVHNTPYESAEGGYIYIWGGPHDAHDVLHSEFSDIIPTDVVEATADQLENEHDVRDWASIPGPEDFDIPSEYFMKFQANIFTAQRLLVQPINKPDEAAFFALLYANAITTLEAYLADAFISLVLKHPSLLRKFVESDPIFKTQRISVAELFRHADSLPKRVRDHLYVLPFHRLEKVQKMYDAVLGIAFPPGLRDILEAVQVRHDIIHRNGVTKDGKQIALARSDVERLLAEVEELVDKIDEKIREVIGQLTADSD
jgi:hypothetical protein